MPGPPRNKPRLTKRQLVDFINQHDGIVSRRDIARAFSLRGPDRTWLRRTLQELEDEGLIDRKRKRRVSAPGRLPAVAVIEVNLIDDDGEVFCRPTTDEKASVDPAIRIRLVQERRGGPAAGLGDRVLARLRRLSANNYEARAIRILEKAVRSFLALYESNGKNGTLRPADRRSRTVFDVSRDHRAGAKHGEYVRAEPVPGDRWGPRRAKVVERLGSNRDPKMFSLLAIHGRDIPMTFSEETLAAAEALSEAPLGDRADLRSLPLVTIDGADARDFDDAVWAEPDTSANSAGGWHAIVAIADVAWYVRPGKALDRAAQERGNSVYFPDRVVPMLPETLSNGLCSLRPNEDHACLAVHLWIGPNGRVRRHRFERGLMRSAARLTYEQVQKAQDGVTDETTGPLLAPVIKPLYDVFAALTTARKARGTLDLDLPERQVVLDDAGSVTGIVPRPRYDSHRLIEELMIAANVAAADALHKANASAMRRIHEPPDADAIEALRQSLSSFGIRLAKGSAIRPALFGGILEQARDMENGQLVSDLVLRAQTKAYYGSADLGHFGLALRRYSHFTSPIRRYADVLVHRALIATLQLGAGGLSDEDLRRLDETAEHISATERRAAMAEREAMDRYATAYLADRVGAMFSARVSGVARFGLFVRLDETNADGLVPIRSLPDDWYNHDEVRHCLIGERSGLTVSLGDPVTVQLTEADVVTGSLAFSLIDGGHMAKSGRAMARKAAGKKRTAKSSQKKGAERKRSRQPGRA